MAVAQRQLPVTVSLYARGTLESVWSRNTSINADTDYRFDLLAENAALASTFAVDHCLDTGSGPKGYVIVDQTRWTIDTINTFGNSEVALPANANATNVSQDGDGLGLALGLSR